MGSSSSKDAATSRSNSMVGTGTRVFHSSCLGRPSPNNNTADADADAHLLDHRNKQIHHLTLTQHFPQVEDEDEDEDEEEEDDDKEVNEILKQQQRHSCAHDTNTTTSSTPPISTRLRSRFGFSFTRLTRAATFRSSSTSSSLFSSSCNHNNNNNAQPPPPPLPSFITTQARDLLPLPPLPLPTSSPPHSLPTLTTHPHTSSAPSPHLTHHHISTSQSTPTTRQLGPPQPLERSVRFSRTLSVGRLRDRVLRRSSFTDGLFGRLQQGRDPGSTQENRRQRGWAEITPTPDPHHVSPSTSAHQLPPMHNSIYNTQHDELETSRPREARYHDIMEHRTDFLERRRRIRSQVRALQRLGSRFENLSGHERSCILAGQHRSGHCTCRMSSRTRNPDDDTSARASISRIVMLAEALFEVLDEIHQQSVVLSSRASVSSLGSIPAPKEVVESMPVKIYTKLQKHQLEEVAQCYICLVEYEEGDCVRILPCHHEFHKTCIDKWLKEIHRVCPLCRGDVCKSESLSSEN